MEHAASYDNSIENSPEQHKSRCLLGMTIFLASEAMLFAGLIGGYIILRLGTGEWPPIGAPALPLSMTTINTILLVASSFTYHWAEVNIKKGNAGTAGLLLTALLGLTFLIVQGFEWHHLMEEGLLISTFGAYGSSFYTLTGFHGFHVFIGWVMVMFCLVRSVFFQAGKASNRPVYKDRIFEEITGLYWHFVDVVWIFLFIILYVI